MKLNLTRSEQLLADAYHKELALWSNGIWVYYKVVTHPQEKIVVFNPETSLDVMHYVEKCMYKCQPPGWADRYDEALTAVTARSSDTLGYNWNWHATAAQRLEAMVRVLKLRPHTIEDSVQEIKDIKEADRIDRARGINPTPWQ